MKTLTEATLHFRSNRYHSGTPRPKRSRAGIAGCYYFHAGYLPEGERTGGRTVAVERLRAFREISESHRRNESAADDRWEIAAFVTLVLICVGLMAAMCHAAAEVLSW